jgi:hypothetical protein
MTRVTPDYAMTGWRKGSEASTGAFEDEAECARTRMCANFSHLVFVYTGIGALYWLPPRGAMVGRIVRWDSKEFSNEEPAKLNRDVALRALWPNSLFSKVVFS